MAPKKRGGEMGVGETRMLRNGPKSHWLFSALKSWERKRERKSNCVTIVLGKN